MLVTVCSDLLIDLRMDTFRPVGQLVPLRNSVFPEDTTQIRCLSFGDSGTRHPGAAAPDGSCAGRKRVRDLILSFDNVVIKQMVVGMHCRASPTPRWQE